MFYCYGKKNFCTDICQCNGCRFYNGAGGEDVEASARRTFFLRLWSFFKSLWYKVRRK